MSLKTFYTCSNDYLISLLLSILSIVLIMMDSQPMIYNGINKLDTKETIAHLVFRTLSLHLFDDVPFAKGTLFTSDNINIQ